MSRYKPTKYIGEKFGNLYVESISHIKRSHKFYMCLCDCGNRKAIVSYSLLSGNAKSCGCLRKKVTSERMTEHGKSHTKVHVAWQNLKDRCYNENNNRYYRYGKRGIVVCEGYLKFENFYADLGDPPHKMSIDRINNDCNYSCGKCEQCINNGWVANCRWATNSEQVLNSSNARIVELNGIKKNLSVWANILKVNPNNLSRSLKKEHLKLKIETRLRQYEFNN